MAVARSRDKTEVDALLDAARSEIATVGLADLSVDAVARRSDVAPMKRAEPLHLGRITRTGRSAED